MINRYSLSDYTVKVIIPEGLITGRQSVTLTLGGPGATGEGSFLGQIRLSRANDTWSTEGDPTGSWVHNKTLNRTGSVDIDIRQVSDDVTRFIVLSGLYESANEANYKGMTFEVYNGLGNIVGKAEDCYPTKVVDQVFGATAENQSWSFTAGKVTFPQTTTWPSEQS